MRQRLPIVILATSIPAFVLSAFLPATAGSLSFRLAAAVVVLYTIFECGRRTGADRSIKNRVRHPDAWTLLGAALVFRTAADASMLANRSPEVLTAILFSASACFNVAALIHMMRQRFGERANDYVAEVVISSGTIGIVLWTLMIAPIYNQMDGPRALATGAIASMTVALPQMVGVLFLTWSFSKRPRSLVFLSIAQAVLFAAAQFYFVGVAIEDDLFTRIALVLFTLHATCLGLGALDSGTDIYEEPTSPQGARLSRPRLVGLILPVILGPALLLLSITGFLNVQPMTVAAISIVLGVLVVGHLLTMVQARASSTHWASHDKLTGLPNRALFRERIAQALDRSRKMGHSIAIMYLDLDRFKHINDSMGHEAGDQLLEQVARRILAGVDATDTVARLGGDEFAILLSEVDDDEVPRKLARRLLKSFSTPFNLRPRPVFMSPSIGIAVSEPGMSLETVLTCADTAMYRAKECGRNNFAVWSQDMNEAAKNRLMLETNLHSAISNHELRLVYQPKVSLRTGQVAGVEALIRWHHPKLGIISPGAFIHLAEETGLIIQIGEWVLVEACRQARIWCENGFPELSVAVNLSSRQFQQPGITDLVAHVLRETGLPSHLLELELTESMAMSGTDTTVTTLEDLKQMGVKCSIDDFGTGYSNFSYLSRFPIDALKIDKSFVQSIDKSSGDASLVIAIIAMARGLGMKTIGEGVETPEQVAFLTKHGCDEIQGYLFSKPLPPAELESLLMLEHVSGGSGRLGLSGNLGADAGTLSPPTVSPSPQPRQVQAPSQPRTSDASAEGARQQPSATASAARQTGSRQSVNTSRPNQRPTTAQQMPAVARSADRSTAPSPPANSAQQGSPRTRGDLFSPSGIQRGAREQPKAQGAQSLGARFAPPVTDSNSRENSLREKKPHKSKPDNYDEFDDFSDLDELLSKPQGPRHQHDQ